MLRLALLAERATGLLTVLLLVVAVLGLARRGLGGVGGQSSAVSSNSGRAFSSPSESPQLRLGCDDSMLGRALIPALVGGARGGGRGEVGGGRSRATLSRPS